ncbi:MAG: hydroxysqualene dehydroxylase HpnE [Ignavibacterium sp.]|nr:hydroxysqualene dehydroxylase HpnE [Ignavibacterium sp.]MDW8374083.1 hydroxysqualene dehydroxylase HpnE [Ignavibacteriales bacterium]
MRKVLIIGGGLAGLSAAVYLSHNKFNVTLIESTRRLGGKVYSFYEQAFNSYLDNGQHILLGCYDETLNFLRLISAFDSLEIPKNFSLNYLFDNQKYSELKTLNIFHPFNLLLGFISFIEFDIFDKLSILKLLIKLRFIDSDNLSNLTVKEWLEIEKQSKKSISLFWEVIAVGALNSSTEIASAKLFCDILKKIFWTNKDAYKILLPKKSLQDTFINPAYEFLERNKAKILLSEKCEKIIFQGNEIKKVITNKRVFEDYDFYVFAIPFYSLKSLGFTVQPEINFNYSPILNLYIKLKENSLTKSHYILVNSLIHWIFNKGDFINITISNAAELNHKSKEKIESLIIEELERFLPGIKQKILKVIVIKEKQATFIPTKEVINNRPSLENKINNMFLAGDWTNTKLPSTIEGAIKSGRICANKIIEELYSKL